MKVYEDLRSAQHRLDGLQNGLAALVALLLLQFWLLQGVDSKRYRELAENNRIRTLSIAAPRGTLTDRNGRIMAENKPAFRIVVTMGPSGLQPFPARNDPEGIPTPPCPGAAARRR